MHWEQAWDYIQQNEDMSIEDIAKKFRMSSAKTGKLMLLYAIGGTAIDDFEKLYNEQEAGRDCFVYTAF